MRLGMTMSAQIARIDIRDQPLHVSTCLEADKCINLRLEAIVILL